MGKARVEENFGYGAYSVTFLLQSDTGDQDGQTVNAWCVDYTNDIEPGTVVGTMETGGTGSEYRNGNFVWVYLIKPGFEDEEVEGMDGPGWTAADGQQQDGQSMSEAAYFWNAAMQPGWQRFKPTVRTGKIISINSETDTCSVCLRPAYDSFIGAALEPDDLDECDDLDEEMPEGDAYVQQMLDFCEREPGHPLCSPVERTNADYDTWWQTIVDINTQVNQGITYARDVGGDYWETVSLPGHGDCEDYALTKMKLLANAGFPTDAMGLAVGKIGAGPARGSTDIDHAWAVVFTSKGIYHLEQAPNVPLGKQPGTNFRILRYNGYEVVARRLDDVPIEYMDCNSGAFAVGDDVVVKFEDQSWDNPMVVGFSEAPKECHALYILLYWTPDSGNTKYAVWDVLRDQYATIHHQGQEISEWPSENSVVASWWASLDKAGNLNDSSWDVSIPRPVYGHHVDGSTTFTILGEWEEEGYDYRHTRDTYSYPSNIIKENANNPFSFSFLDSAVSIGGGYVWKEVIKRRQFASSPWGQVWSSSGGSCPRFYYTSLAGGTWPEPGRERGRSASKGREINFGGRTYFGCLAFSYYLRISGTSYETDWGGYCARDIENGETVANIHKFLATDLYLLEPLENLSISDLNEIPQLSSLLETIADDIPWGWPNAAGKVNIDCKYIPYK